MHAGVCACVHSTSIATMTNPQECTVINIHVRGVLLGNAHTAKFVKMRMLTPLDNRMLSTVRLHLDLLTLHACVHPLVAVEIKKKLTWVCSGRVVGTSTHWQGGCRGEAGRLRGRTRKDQTLKWHSHE